MMDWQSCVGKEVLNLRAKILASIREFFAIRGVLEVETPLLSTGGTIDPSLESFETHYRGPCLPPQTSLYLQTSPEFAMKRLLASGSGAIYQICKAFRNGEAGAWHNPEFTLLEWYRPGFDHHQLMAEVECLLRDIMRPWRILGDTEQKSYCTIFESQLGLDPLVASVHDLRCCAAQKGVQWAGKDLGEDRDAWLDLLVSHRIAPDLGRHGLCFLYDYPASQAALARLCPDDPRLAERFEVYLQGIELANGFHELTDPKEQEHRLRLDASIRQSQGKADIPIDQRFLQALHAGLPPCAGVAVGLDRVIMIVAKASSLSKVIAFPIDRA